MIFFYTRGYSPFVGPVTLVVDYDRASERLLCALHITRPIGGFTGDSPPLPSPCCTTRLLSQLRTMVICQHN